MKQTMEEYKNKTKTLKILAVILIMFISIAAAIIFLATPSKQPWDSEASTTENTYISPYYTVTYEVTGFAKSVSVTYENQDGGTSQKSSVSLPWTLKLYRMTSGDFVYISAQNNGDYGYIDVNIYLDDILVKTSSSTGAYVIATASGRI